MIKQVLFAISFFPPLVQSAESHLREFRFIEAKSIKELSQLPPKIEMTLEILCNEEFYKVIRHEWIDPKTKNITIALGALARENLLSSCAGEKKGIKVDAGTTFSGRKYEIVRIKK